MWKSVKELPEAMLHLRSRENASRAPAWTGPRPTQAATPWLTADRSLTTPFFLSYHVEVHKGFCASLLQLVLTKFPSNSVIPVQ